MLSFARPLLFWAGTALVIVPVLLHLIARRPPDRRALPTMRFLQRDPLVAIRVDRRPSDLPLLLLRCALILLISAAAAGAEWIPRGGAGTEIVLLDRTITRGPGWAAAVDSARAILTRDGVAHSLVLFDTGSIIVSEHELNSGFLDSLEPQETPASLDYAAAFRALPAAVGAGDPASSRVTLITAARWGGWSSGLTQIRSAWPGEIRVVDIPSTRPVATLAPDTMRGEAAIVSGDPAAGRFVEAALASLDWNVRRAARWDDGADLMVFPNADQVAAADLLSLARSGTVLILAGSTVDPALAELVGWRRDPSPAPRTISPGFLLLDDGTRVDGAASRFRGTPSPDATVLAVWEDGDVAATARKIENGCVVFAATPLEEGRLPLSAGFPRLVDRLVKGCVSRVPAGDDRPLDTAARAFLAESAPTATSALFDPPAGTSITRWLLAAALLVGLIETILAYGPRRN